MILVRIRFRFRVVTVRVVGVVKVVSVIRVVKMIWVIKVVRLTGVVCLCCFFLGDSVTKRYIGIEI